MQRQVEGKQVSIKICEVNHWSLRAHRRKRSEELKGRDEGQRCTTGLEAEKRAWAL